ncbi:hypothetical protein H7K20_24690 [Priestia aryabhattai]|nr:MULTISPECIES: hypothetical protein [Priestia]HWL25252.1 hypothetical protein [Ureibacillus sp.]KWU68652.1 hypothetical protein AWX17_00155 [Priestia megaterium]MBY0030279.1 hypothetical protein [Priestia aryabhattai]MED3822093.1 hypothetical protein [Priestia aryabhattai]QSF42212.1 hypothetical protein ICR96_29985 [Priestia megaterium]
MHFLSWYDWITPTNPYAALLLGLIFITLLALNIWFQIKSWSTLLISLTTGVLVVFIGVIILNSIGWYN